MKTLPDVPNLDHLRQQAKDVLPQLRGVRPAATLSDAQALVAEQYGFRAWPDLAAEVNRRTASIRHDDESAEAVAEVFNLGKPTGPLVALERQWAGQAWSLTTERGRWLARQLFEWFDEAGVASEVLLAEAAAASGILTARPVRSVTGHVVEALHGGRWRVYELPSMGPEPPTPAQPRHAVAAGRIIGRVHRLGLPAPQPPARWITITRSEEQWRALHRASQDAGAPWAALLAEVMPAIVEVSTIIEPADTAGAAVLSASHYAPNAFRIAGPDELAVVSWEHAGAIPLRWDLGGAVLSWSGGVRGVVNAPAARGVLAGYAEVADVPGGFDIGVFTAAMCASLNWLATRIQIALKEGDEERRAVAAHAVPGLLADPPTRPNLERLVEAVDG